MDIVYESALNISAFERGMDRMDARVSSSERLFAASSEARQSMARKMAFEAQTFQYSVNQFATPYALDNARKAQADNLRGAADAARRYEQRMTEIGKSVGRLFAASAGSFAIMDRWMRSAAERSDAVAGEVAKLDSGIKFFTDNWSESVATGGIFSSLGDLAKGAWEAEKAFSALYAKALYFAGGYALGLNSPAEVDMADQATEMAVQQNRAEQKLRAEKMQRLQIEAQIASINGDTVRAAQAQADLQRINNDLSLRKMAAEGATVSQLNAQRAAMHSLLSVAVEKARTDAFNARVATLWTDAIRSREDAERRAADEAKRRQDAYRDGIQGLVSTRQMLDDADASNAAARIDLVRAQAESARSSGDADRAAALDRQAASLQRQADINATILRYERDIRQVQEDANLSDSRRNYVVAQLERRKADALRIIEERANLGAPEPSSAAVRSAGIGSGLAGVRGLAAQIFGSSSSPQLRAAQRTAENSDKTVKLLDTAVKGVQGVLQKLDSGVGAVLA